MGTSEPGCGTATGEVSFQVKLKQLFGKTVPVTGNVRTDGEVNYIMPNRAARRKAEKAARGKAPLR